MIPVHGVDGTEFTPVGRSTVRGKEGREEGRKSASDVLTLTPSLPLRVQPMLTNKVYGGSHIRPAP